jgi:transcription elongation factor Elf1
MIICGNCGDRHEDAIDVKLCHDATAYEAYVAGLSEDERDADRQAELANERAREWRNHWATIGQ